MKSLRTFNKFYKIRLYYNLIEYLRRDSEFQNPSKGVQHLLF